MTNEEIRTKVAEALGWKSPFNEREWLYNSGSEGEDVYGKFVGTDACGDREQVPNYPFDLNACAEFEKTLMEYHGLYWFNLAEEVSGFKREEFDYSNEYFLADIACATARQRCLAYLKTKGILP